MKDGKEEAFEGLLEALEKRLISFLYRYVQDRTVAEELFSETMARVVKNIDSFEPRAKLSTWIFTIARNLAYDHLKSARTKRTNTRDFNDEETQNVIYLRDVLTDEGTNPARELHRKEGEEKIQKLIKTLEPKLKEPLLLKFYEKLKYREIGEILDIPTGTAKYRVHRAIKQLESLWERQQTTEDETKREEQ